MVKCSAMYLYKTILCINVVKFWIFLLYVTLYTKLKLHRTKIHKLDLIKRTRCRDKQLHSCSVRRLFSKVDLIFLLQKAS